MASHTAAPSAPPFAAPPETMRGLWAYSMVKTGIMTDAEVQAQPENTFHIGNTMFPFPRGTVENDYRGLSFLRYKLIQFIEAEYQRRCVKKGPAAFEVRDRFVGCDAIMREREQALLTRIQTDAKCVSLDDCLDYMMDVRVRLVAHGLLDLGYEPDLQDPVGYEARNRALMDEFFPDYSRPRRELPPAADSLRWEREIDPVVRAINAARLEWQQQEEDVRLLMRGFPEGYREDLVVARRVDGGIRTPVDPEDLLNQFRRVVAKVKSLEKPVEQPRETFSAPASVGELTKTFVMLSDGVIGVRNVDRREALRACARSSNIPECTLEHLRLRQALDTPYDAVILDLDGTCIDSYNSTTLPVASQLRLLAGAGVPIAIVTGRAAGDVALLLGDARIYPGLQIYGKNGGELWEGGEKKWKEDPQNKSNQLIPACQGKNEDYARLKERIAQICESNLLINAVVHVIKPKNDCLTITIATYFRTASSRGVIDNAALMHLQKMLLRELGPLPEGFVFHSCGDALQILPRQLGKDVSLERFASRVRGLTGKYSPRILRIGDQGQIGGNDHPILTGGCGFSVEGFNAPSIDPDGLYVPPSCWRAPQSRTAGTAWVLKHSLYFASGASLSRMRDVLPEEAAVSRRRTLGLKKVAYTFPDDYNPMEAICDLAVHIDARSWLEVRGDTRSHVPLPECTIELLSALLQSREHRVRSCELPSAFPYDAPETLRRHVLVPLCDLVRERTGKHLDIDVSHTDGGYEVVLRPSTLRCVLSVPRHPPESPSGRVTWI